MQNIFRRVRRLVLPGLTAMALLQAEANAVVIKVFGPSETSGYEDMKAAAAKLRERWNEGAFATSGPIGSFQYLIADADVFPLSFSMAPGTKAYFWSDKSFKFENGFHFQASSMAFGKPMETKPNIKQAARPLMPQGATMLRQASLRGSSLQIEYSLKAAAPVTLELIAMNGKSLGSWNWNDGAAGIHNRALTVSRMPRSGTVLMRWTSGQYRAVKKLNIVQ